MQPPFDLLDAAKKTMKNAYAPYSHFSVAAAIRTDQNQIFSGCNVENCSLGMTLCAETTAVGTMVSQGGKKIKEILIISQSDAICTPCGGCRQRLQEFSFPDTIFYLCSSTGDCEKFTMTELLPLPFTNFKGNEA